MKGSGTQADHLLVRARRLHAEHRARAKRDDIGQLPYTVMDLKELLACNPLCEYCRTPLSFAASIDHRQPIARGGRHALDNLAVCCDRCNRLKGMLTESEFAELLTFLALLHPAARMDLERRILAGSEVYSRGRRRQGA